MAIEERPFEFVGSLMVRHARNRRECANNNEVVILQRRTRGIRV